MAWSVTKGRGKKDGAGYCGVWMGAGNGEWPKRAGYRGRQERPPFGPEGWGAGGFTAFALDVRVMRGLVSGFFRFSQFTPTGFWGRADGSSGSSGGAPTISTPTAASRVSGDH